MGGKTRWRRVSNVARFDCDQAKAEPVGVNSKRLRAAGVERCFRQPLLENRFNRRSSKQRFERAKRGGRFRAIAQYQPRAGTDRLNPDRIGNELAVAAFIFLAFGKSQRFFRVSLAERQFRFEDERVIGRS